MITYEDAVTQFGTDPYIKPILDMLGSLGLQNINEYQLAESTSDEYTVGRTGYDILDDTEAVVGNVVYLRIGSTDYCSITISDTNYIEEINQISN